MGVKPTTTSPPGRPRNGEKEAIAELANPLRIVMVVYDVYEFAQIPAEILESYGYGNVLVDHPM